MSVAGLEQHRLQGTGRALTPELEKPFGIELGQDNTLLAYRFVDSPSALTLGIRQTLALALQVTRADAASWTSEERDSARSWQNG